MTLKGCFLVLVCMYLATSSTVNNLANVVNKEEVFPVIAVLKLVVYF